MKNEWIKVYEYSNTKTSSKIWLEDLLESNNIPFRNEVKSYWEGNVKSPSYKEKILIYIPIDFKSQVEKYIEEYNDENNILSKDIEELKTNDDTEYEARKTTKKQQIIKKVFAGIVIAMIVSIVLAGIFIK